MILQLMLLHWEKGLTTAQTITSTMVVHSYYTEHEGGYVPMQGNISISCALACIGFYVAIN